MRLAICTAFWQRLPLSRIWWKAAVRACDVFGQHGITTQIFAAVSEPEHIQLTKDFGGIPCEVPNLPLGNKWNCAMSHAYQEEPDYYFIVGSDDFFGSNLLAKYVPWMQEGKAYIGVEGMYFTEPATRRALKFPGYPIDHSLFGAPVGSGRMIRADLMPRRPWPWFAEVGLDGDITKLLHDYFRVLLTVDSEHPAVDVKTATNMWSYDRLQQSYKGAPLEPATIEEALAHIPEREELLALDS